MAATTTLLARYLTAGPVIREVWAWALTTPTTEVTITPTVATADTQGIGVIKRIDLVGAPTTSHTAAPILEFASNTDRSALILTTVTDNNGTVSIEGLSQ